MNITYTEARDQIAPGDIIAVRNDGLIGKAFALVDGLPYTHIAIAGRWETRIWSLESNIAGVGARLLSNLAAQHPVDIFPCPVDGDEAVKQALLVLGKPCAYDWIDDVRIASAKILRKLGRPNLAAACLPNAEDGRRVCSTTAALILRRAGWQPESLPLYDSPADLVRALGVAPKLQIAKG